MACAHAPDRQARLERADAKKAEDERRDDRPKAPVHVLEFADERGASNAGADVRFDLRVLALGKAAAHVGREALGHREAVHVVRRRKVLLEIGLTERFPRPIGEGGDAVGAEPKERGHLGGRLLLDLRVPQDDLPPFGKRPEGIGHDALLKVVERRLVTRFLVAERLVVGPHVLVWSGSPPLGDHVEARAPHHGKEVCAEGHVGPVALLERLENPGEGLGNDVVDVARNRGVHAGHASRRRAVPLEEHAEGRRLAGAHASDKLGVTGLFSPETYPRVVHQYSDRA